MTFKQDLVMRFKRVMAFLVEIAPIAIVVVIGVVLIYTFVYSIDFSRNSYERMEAIYQECLAAEVFTDYQCVIVATKGK